MVQCLASGVAGLIPTLGAMRRPGLRLCLHDFSLPHKDDHISRVLYRSLKH